MYIIDEHYKQRLRRLKEYAEKNPYTMDDLLDIANRQIPPPAETPNFHITLPVGYKVVYSIELQKHTIRHLSVSSAHSPYPSIFVVREIMQELGFNHSLEKCHVYGEGTAINVIEPLEKLW